MVAILQNNFIIILIVIMGVGSYPPCNYGCQDSWNCCGGGYTGISNVGQCNNWCPGYTGCCDTPAIPTCTNWCPQTSGQQICCDFGYGGYQGNIYNTNTRQTTNTNTVYCPAITCAVNNYTRSNNCTSDNDCRRIEKCCNNPCLGGINKCLVAQSRPTENILNGCPQVVSCSTWIPNNINASSCTSNDDCKRTEVCCHIPCNTTMICQTIIRNTNTNINTYGRGPGQTVIRIIYN